MAGFRRISAIGGKCRSVRVLSSARGPAHEATQLHCRSCQHDSRFAARGARKATRGGAENRRPYALSRGRFRRAGTRRCIRLNRWRNSDGLRAVTSVRLSVGWGRYSPCDRVGRRACQVSTRRNHCEWHGIIGGSFEEHHHDTIVLVTVGDRTNIIMPVAIIVAGIKLA